MEGTPAAGPAPPVLPIDPVIIVGEYAHRLLPAAHIAKPMGMHHDNSIYAAGDLFVVGNLLWNVRKMHFRLSHSKAIYDIAQCGR